MLRYTGGTIEPAWECGTVRYGAAAPPRFAMRGDCRDCQQITGTGHLPQVAVTRGSFSVTGPVTRHQRSSETGNPQELGLCGTCGLPLYKMTALAPEIMVIAAGSLDHPEQAPPFKPVFEESRLPWDES